MNFSLGIFYSILFFPLCCEFQCLAHKSLFLAGIIQYLEKIARMRKAILPNSQQIHPEILEERLKTQKLKAETQ